jgi:hypothetical protein
MPARVSARGAARISGAAIPYDPFALPQRRARQQEVSAVTEPTTRAEIMARYRQAAAAWDHSFAQLTGEQTLRPLSPGGWTPKDVLAHIAADHRWLACQLEALARGERPTAFDCYGDDTPTGPQFDFATTDGRNAWQHERLRDLPLETVRRMAAESRARLDSALASLPDETFPRPYTIADNGHTGWVRPAAEGEQGWTMAVWVTNATWRHFEEHLRDLPTARA